MSRSFRHGVLSILTLLAVAPALLAAGEKIGLFKGQADVGKVQPPGSAQFEKSTGQYRITSAGENVWGTHDDFHFVYNKVPAAGEIVLTAQVAFEGKGKNPHRKAGCMIRQSLEPGAPYADIMVHGDGLISLQYRDAPNGPTREIKSQVKAPAVVRIERRGDKISASVAPEESPKPPAFVPVGSIELKLTDVFNAGLAVCSHEAQTQETAVFSAVEFKQMPAAPERK
jgi:TolB protein